MILVSRGFIVRHLYAAASDAVTLRTPNARILSVLVGYVATVAMLRPDRADFITNAAITSAFFAGGALLFARDRMTGGNGKQCAMIALCIRPPAMPAFFH